MAKQTIVFIGWSKPQGREVATALRDWLKRVMPSSTVTCFVSSKDISAGSAWERALIDKLKDADLAIICLAKGNVANVGIDGPAETFCTPWLIYEAGFLSHKLNDDRVIPFTFGIGEIPGPLARYQAVSASRAGAAALVKRISEIADVEQIVRSDEQFPLLKQKLRKIRNVDSAQRGRMREIFDAKRRNEVEIPLRGSSVIQPLGFEWKYAPLCFVNEEDFGGLTPSDIRVYRNVLQIVLNRTDLQPIIEHCNRELQQLDERLNELTQRKQPSVSDRRAMLARFGIRA